MQEILVNTYYEVSAQGKRNGRGLEADVYRSMYWYSIQKMLIVHI